MKLGYKMVVPVCFSIRYLKFPDWECVRHCTCIFNQEPEVSQPRSNFWLRNNVPVELKQCPYC